MTKATLHFIYDPLCGWCYGAEPLTAAARGVPGLDIALRGGGLWPEPTQLPSETRHYIKEADARVGAMSGQPYGEPYLSGLLFDPDLTLDSRPVTAAVLAADKVAGKGWEMLHGIQHGHYEHGWHVVRPDVLQRIAADIGLDRDAFAEALDSVDVDTHIMTTRRFMAQIGATGFPAFVLRIKEQWFAVPNRQFASDPAGFRQWLERTIEEHSRIEV
jgi:putative protein-disulfide isomerase